MLKTIILKIINILLRIALALFGVFLVGVVYIFGVESYAEFMYIPYGILFIALAILNPAGGINRLIISTSTLVMLIISSGMQMDVTPPAVIFLTVASVLFLVERNTQKQHASPPQKVSRTVLIIIGSLIAIAPLLTIGFKIIQINQKNELVSSLASEADKSLKNQYSKTKQAATEYFSIVSQSFNLLQPAFTVAYDYCYTDYNKDHSSGRGVTISYNYKCLITHAALVEVPKSSSASLIIDQLARPGSEERRYYTEAHYGKLYYADITTLQAQELLQGNYASLRKLLPGELPIIMSGTYTSPDDVFALGAVAYYDKNSSIITDADQKALANRKIIERNGGKVLNQDKDYIILQYSEHYLEKDIGCKMPKALFCDSPIQ